MNVSRYCGPPLHHVALVYNKNERLFISACKTNDTQMWPCAPGVDKKSKFQEKCIPGHLKCDGHVNCGAGLFTDESDCGHLSSGEFGPLFYGSPRYLRPSPSIISLRRLSKSGELPAFRRLVGLALTLGLHLLWTLVEKETKKKLIASSHGPHTC